jgi:hypothetical protein
LGKGEFGDVVARVLLSGGIHAPSRNAAIGGHKPPGAFSYTLGGQASGPVALTVPSAPVHGYTPQPGDLWCPGWHAAFKRGVFQWGGGGHGDCASGASPAREEMVRGGDAEGGWGTPLSLWQRGAGALLRGRVRARSPMASPYLARTARAGLPGRGLLRGAGGERARVGWKGPGILRPRVGVPERPRTC